jgi:hypothetical protein
MDEARSFTISAAPQLSAWLRPGASAAAGGAAQNRGAALTQAHFS